MELFPCIVQDARTGEVLTLAYVNDESLARTRETGEMWFWSRSRDKLWHKGETSGNVQRVRAIRYDCDSDAYVALVDPAGPACHTGERTCFYRGEMDRQPAEALPALERVIEERRSADPSSSYTAELLAEPGRIGEKVREWARDHNLVPLRHTFIADCETPVSAYLKLRGDGPSFLLESAEQGQRVGRWSFLGIRPRTVIRLSLDEHPDPYALVAEELGRYRIAPLAGLPPFAGGAVGLFGYDLVRLEEPTVGKPGPDLVGVPDLALMVTDLLLAFDHLRHEVTVLASVFTEDDVERSYEDAAAAIAEVRERLAGPAPRAEAGRREPPELTSDIGSDGYAAAVERSKEYIRAGDVYQVVPSQRWSGDCPVDAFSIYRGLRTVNPSPYMFFLDFEDFEIAGASPESLVKVSGRRGEQRPHARTRPPAGATPGDLEIARA